MQARQYSASCSSIFATDSSNPVLKCQSSEKNLQTWVCGRLEDFKNPVLK